MSKTKKTRDESMDEIVFAHRNKEYGAYELRKRYKKNVIKSLSFAFFLLLLTTITPLIMAFNSQDGKNFIPISVIGDFSRFGNPDEIPPPPPPPPPPPVPDPVRQIKYKAIEIVDDTLVKNIEMPTNDELADNNTSEEISTEFVEPVDAIKENNDPVEIWGVDEKPEFPGGEIAMLEWLANNTKYPKEAIEIGVTGKVCVKFVINKAGKVTDIELIKGIDEYLDKEALRVVSEMPNWTPGKHNGEALNVTFRLPIKFTLCNK